LHFDCSQLLHSWLPGRLLLLLGAAWRVPLLLPWLLLLRLLLLGRRAAGLLLLLLLLLLLGRRLGCLGPRATTLGSS
jgi:hypothetical protein